MNDLIDEFESPVYDLIDEFESPVKEPPVKEPPVYDFPSPPKTKPRKKKYVSTIDTNDINKIAKKLGLNQLSLDQIEQLEKYTDDQRLINIKDGVAIDYLLKNINDNKSLTFAIGETRIKLLNMISKLRKGKGTKRRRKTRNKKTKRGKKKPRKKTHKRKRK